MDLHISNLCCSSVGCTEIQIRAESIKVIILILLFEAHRVQITDYCVLQKPGAHKVENREISDQK